jgi:hypothetical protein
MMAGRKARRGGGLAATRYQGLTGFPTQANTGTPPGWTPASTVNGNVTVTTPGAVIQDLQVNDGDIIVNAAGVTVQRCLLVGGSLQANVNGTVFQDCEIRKSATIPTTDAGNERVGGGYIARRLKLTGVPEGFRAGGGSSGITGVRIEDCYAQIHWPDVCNDWHGDGLQGYDGPPIVVRNMTIDFIETGSCGGTAPFFVPANQGNTSVDIDRLLLKGGGESFRCGVPGTVTNLFVVRTGNAPIDVKCSVITQWSAWLCDLDGAGQPTNLAVQACNTEGGL